MLSLWCEWPDRPHLLHDGAADYPLDTVPKTLTGHLPYLITGLGILAPGALAAGYGDRAQAAIEAVAATLEFLKDRTDTPDGLAELRAATPVGPYRRTAAGADSRALHQALEALESKHHKNWGGLAPVSRPEDRRIIYLGREHQSELHYPYTPSASTT